MKLRTRMEGTQNTLSNVMQRHLYHREYTSAIIITAAHLHVTWVMAHAISFWIRSPQPSPSSPPSPVFRKKCRDDGTSRRPPLRVPTIVTREKAPFTERPAAMDLPQFYQPLPLFRPRIWLVQFDLIVELNGFTL